jgi:integrase
VLRRLLIVAKKRGLIEAVPEIEWLKVPRPDFDFLSFEEGARLTAATDPQWKCMVVTAMKTGLRQGELLALRWEDIDLVSGLMRVRRSVTRGVVTVPKSGKGVGRQAHGARGRRFRQGHGATQSPGSWGQGRG